MKLNPKKTVFGRHETFALRYSWLTKGFQTPKEVFSSDDATVVLGVGKNMVKSIQYWLKACRIVDADMKPTQIGSAIFAEDGFDPYLEDEATIWLLHWLLTSHSDLATAWYWFFNYFHKPEFTSVEVQTALADFVKEKLKANTSVNTIKNDATLILRMYSQNQTNSRIPIEESLDSPLSLLRLIHHSSDGRQYFSKLESRSQLPIGVLAYAITEVFEHLSVNSLPIEDLMYSHQDLCAPGMIFRLTESDLIAKLEKLVIYSPDAFAIRETAGIHQLYKLKDIQAIDFLYQHYGVETAYRQQENAA